MRFLIITQKVDKNDDVLGFMHGWIAEFAVQCEKVTVICLQKGEYSLPSNVTVLSLGKPPVGWSPLLADKILQKTSALFNFFKYIWTERNNYDTVFVHMNPEYIVLGGWLWRVMGKKISLWYAHGHVTLALRAAELIVDGIFTSTVSGCCLKSRKIKVIGQGIDTEKLGIKNHESMIGGGLFRIITVGRISPVKDYETLIRAAELLNENDVKFSIDIIGGAGLAEQEKYLSDLKIMVKEKHLENVIKFLGPKPNREILSYLQLSDLFVNMSHTGSLDKAILEAMSVGLPILTCNVALKEVLGSFTDELMFEKGKFNDLAVRISRIIKLPPESRSDLGIKLRDIVVKEHSLSGFVRKILFDYVNLTNYIR